MTALLNAALGRVRSIDTRISRRSGRRRILVDARTPAEFAKSTIGGALNAPLDDVLSGKLKVPLPEDDFNRRVVLFGSDPAQARKLAEFFSTRPWHNVSYVSGTFEELAALGSK